MSRINPRPIIFALSNPTSRAECTAEQAYAWSNGQALYAAGAPFPETTLQGKTFHPGQANYFYIFPAIGLATYAARPKRLIDACFVAAAQATADQVDPIMRAKGMLFPSQAHILETEATTAARVAEFMFDPGLAQVERPPDIRRWIESLLYRPHHQTQSFHAWALMRARSRLSGRAGRTRAGALQGRRAAARSGGRHG